MSEDEIFNGCEFSRERFFRNLGKCPDYIGVKKHLLLEHSIATWIKRLSSSDGGLKTGAS
jgi:hypothetical protein